MAEPAKKSSRVATTTAGLRGVAWKPDRLPADTAISVHPLATEDGAQVTGYLFRRGGERTVVCAMHPRELSVPQYVVPEVLRGGCAMWVQGGRSPGNDIRLEHESALLDLAAGQKFLRESAGFEKTVLQGTSGGGRRSTASRRHERATSVSSARRPGARPGSTRRRCRCRTV